MPAAARAVPLHRLAGWFPAVGLLVGALAGAGYGLSSGLGLPPAVAAWAAVVTEVLVTGALHLDGLADAADGLGGSTPAERRQIMKDPRLGTFGGTALFLALSGRGVLVAALVSAGSGSLLSPASPVGPLSPMGIQVAGGARVIAALMLAHAVARWSLVWALARYPYARPEGGTGRAFAAAGSGQVVMAGVLVAVAGWLLAGVWGLATALAGGIAGAGAAAFLARRLGGITGDACGAAAEVSLLTALMVLAVVPW